MIIKKHCNKPCIKTPTPSFFIIYLVKFIIFGCYLFMDLEKAILALIRSKGCVKIVAVIPPILANSKC